MSHIRVNEFRPGSELPQLFSKVHGFRFFGSAPLLRHRRLPEGPRGFTVISVRSTGHEGHFVEPDRRALTIVTGGRSDVSVSGARYALKPGDMFHIGQAEWHSRLMPETEGGAYESYSVIAPEDRVAPTRAGPPGKHVPNYRKGQQLRQLLELAFEIHEVADFVFDTKIALVEALIDEMFQEAMAPAPKVSGLAQERATRGRLWPVSLRPRGASLQAAVRGTAIRHAALGTGAASDRLTGGGPSRAAGASCRRASSPADADPRCRRGRSRPPGLR